MHLVLLQLLKVLFPVQPLLLGHALEHLQNTGHHALETTEVDVGTVGQQVKHLISILLHLVLDVHLAPALVGLLTGEGVVNAELIGVGLGNGLDLFVVQLGIGIGHTHEQPGKAGELVRGDVLKEHAAPEGAEGGNTGTGGNHDDGGVGVFGQQQHLAGGASHGDFGAGGGIAQEVGADALLGGIVTPEFGVPVGGTTHAERGGLSIEVVAVAGGGNGVEAGAVGDFLALGVDLGAGGDDTVGLALHKGDLAVGLDDDVASFTGGLGADNALNGDDLGLEGGLGAKGVHGEADVFEFKGHRVALDLLVWCCVEGRGK